MNYGAVLSYTEPLSKRSLLEFNYSYNNNNSESGKETFDIDKNTGKHTIKNELFSSDFDNTYTYNRGGIGWRHQRKNYNFTIGSAVQHAQLDSRFHFMGKDSAINQSFVNFLRCCNTISISIRTSGCSTVLSRGSHLRCS